MINKEVELMIDKLCRCCMCENENMHNLFEAASNPDEAKMVSFSEMLIACASVEVGLLRNFVFFYILYLFFFLGEVGGRFT